MSVIDIAKDISEGLARVATAGEVDGEVVDLRTTIDKDCTLNILTFKDEAGKAAYRHTTSHVLDVRIPILFSSFPVLNPGVPASTKNIEIPFVPFVLSVIAVMQ